MTQEAIINAGLKCFASYGYSHTSLANIAEEVGIKKPSLYNHFNSKNDIFLSVLASVGDREIDYLSSLEPTAEEQSIEERLHQLYKRYIQHLSESMEGLFFKRVTFFPPEEFAQDIRQMFTKVESKMNDLLCPIMEQGKKDKALRSLPTETLTSAYYTLIDGLFLEENFYDRDVFEKRQQASWEIFWLGIQYPAREE